MKHENDDRSDEELALLAAASPDSIEGRQAACTVLGRYTTPVYRWCHAYVRDREQAEDLAQEILLRAYTRLGDFEGWGRFSAWLFTIARNICLDALRRNARRRPVAVEEETMADPRPGPDAELDASRAEQELLELIARHLSAQEQEAVWLRCMEKMPLNAITRALGIRQASGARAVLQNARRKLRAALGARSPLTPEDCEDE
jgi:RNA polymerase sigma-70 factor, ECF subfamily